jgi:hypothetical protein
MSNLCHLETSTVTRSRTKMGCCVTEINRGLGIGISLTPGINFVKIKESIAEIIFSTRYKTYSKTYDPAN